MTRRRPNRVDYQALARACGNEPIVRVPAVLAKEVAPNEPEARVGTEPKPPQPKDDQWRNKDG